MVTGVARNSGTLFHKTKQKRPPKNHVHGGKAFTRESERVYGNAQALSPPLGNFLGVLQCFRGKQAFPLSLVASACSLNFESCPLTLGFLAFPLNHFPRRPQKQLQATKATGCQAAAHCVFVLFSLWGTFILQFSTSSCCKTGQFPCGFGFPFACVFFRRFSVFRAFVFPQRGKATGNTKRNW